MSAKPARKARSTRTPATGKATVAEPKRSGRIGVKPIPKLPQTARSKTEAAMHERLATLEPGSQRYRVLVCAIDFKRSWLDLGDHLTQVARSGAFKEWGYRTFEAYAQHELYLRRDTAQKLTRSFDFLSSYEPRALEEARKSEDRSVPIPDFQALDVLAEARKNPQLSETDYKTIRDQVFGEDLTASQVKKLVRERAPEPPKEQKEDPNERLRKCLQLAERLYGMLLEDEEVPEKITKAVEDAVGGLRRLIDE